MTNNDVLRSLRHALELTPSALAAFFEADDAHVPLHRVAAMLKEEGEPGFEPLPDLLFAHFLDGLVASYRGKRAPDPNAPPLEGGEDEGDIGDPRAELIRRLLDYQKYKEAARELGERPVVGRNVWTRRAPVVGVEPAEAPLLPIGVHKLIEAFEGVLRKARIKLAHDVVVDRISITDKIHALSERIAAEDEIPFEACFGIGPHGSGDADAIDRFDVVITFLAILEMTRLHLLALRQDGDRGAIFLCRPPPAPEAPTTELKDDYK